LKLRIHKSDYSQNYDESNDYSKGSHSGAYINWSKITMYQNDSLIWGTEPGLGSLMSKAIPTVEPVEALGEGNVYSYPNPSAGETNIRFSVLRPAEVKIYITDINGKLAAGFVLEMHNVKAGMNTFTWNGKNQNNIAVANGVYLLKIQAEGRTVIKRMAIIK
jgi:hypothetical protein